MLEEKFRLEYIENVVLSKKEFQPLPLYNDRKAWENIYPMIYQHWIDSAEARINKKWEELSATRYMDFFTNGDQQTFTDLYTERRWSLLSFLIAECLEGKGRFMQDIVNGVWAFCEESSWTIPAHNNHMQGSIKRILPNVEEELPFIDIRSAEAASLLAWIYYFLKESLDEISPLICKRIAYELKKRIFNSYLQRDDFGWMGLMNIHQVSDKEWQVHRPNNWNPWIVSNCLAAFLLIEDDQSIRVNAVEKSLRILDRFVVPYPEDGGCDEGPTYWKFAGGALFDCLELLLCATGGKLNFYENQKIRNIGQYVYKSFIHEEYYTNFADASAKTVQPALLLYRYGCRIQDENLKNLGLYSVPFLFDEVENRSRTHNVYRKFCDVVTDIEVFKECDIPPILKDTWLSDIEIMTARENEGTVQGLYLAAKAGHNNESHNHNDLGNYIVYLDGCPAIIDIGVESYNPKSFSKDRYSLYTMQSCYHNLPTVNGILQHAGAYYKATDARYSQVDGINELSMNLEQAYTTDSQIKTWKRTCRLIRGEEARIEIIDDFSINNETSDIYWTMMTSPKPIVEEDRIILTTKNGSSLAVYYPSDIVCVEIENIPVTNPWLVNGWGDMIYRVMFKMKYSVSSGEFILKILNIGRVNYAKST